MSQAAHYRDDFLDDLAPAFAGFYREWYPWCHTTVLATLETLASREFIDRAAGSPLSDQAHQTLRTVWFDPYRSYHTRSGKMLRPVLVCLLMRAFDRDPRELPAVVAMAEVIHAASLVLDDIADDSPLRRGAETAHRMVGVRVAGAGASAWLNASFELLSQPMPGLDATRAARLLEAIAWEHWVTGVGTTIDTTWPWIGGFDRTPAQYLQSVVHRSTSYTYRLPLKIGAIAAGATPEQTRRIAAFGEELGLAFQIIDDILNVQPGDEHWGKALAEDITQGKINLQVLLSLQRLAAPRRARLIQILESRTQDPATLHEAVALMDASGAFEAARAIALQHVDRTKALVQGLDFLSPTCRQQLAAFVDYVIQRKR